MKFFTGYRSLRSLLNDEFIQRRYEGFLIPDAARKLLEALEPDGDSEERLAEIYSILEQAPRDPDFHYVQPFELEDIRRERPAADHGRRRIALTQAELLDKFHGAWTGRCVGCALGKPVEGVGMRGGDGMTGRVWIREYLKSRKEWPLHDYFAGNEKLACPPSWRENIAFMEPDDDIHYTLIGLKVMEARGADFTWRDIANMWNSSLPYNAICTAETQAIMNYNIMTPRDSAFGSQACCTPFFCSRNNNPYREWIGAQIRADFWGYACAGNPELAAEFAWRDAHWTHQANGIYGEMFIAAVTAGAFVCSDWSELMRIGLAEIPASCRLAEDLRWCVERIAVSGSFEEFMDEVDRRFNGMSPVHTNNNCVICAAALCFGKNDPELTAELAVSGALDTDCNGATAASIAGIIAGRGRFDGHLANRLNDLVKPRVFGFENITMRELAERTLRVFERVSAL